MPVRGHGRATLISQRYDLLVFPTNPRLLLIQRKGKDTIDQTMPHLSLPPPRPPPPLEPGTQIVSEHHSATNTHQCKTKKISHRVEKKNAPRKMPKITKCLPNVPSWRKKNKPATSLPSQKEPKTSTRSGVK